MQPLYAPARFASSIPSFRGKANNAVTGGNLRMLFSPSGGSRKAARARIVANTTSFATTRDSSELAQARVAEVNGKNSPFAVCFAKGMVIFRLFRALQSGSVALLRSNSNSCLQHDLYGDDHDRCDEYGRCSAGSSAQSRDCRAPSMIEDALGITPN